jgi:hypothetical protein
VLAQNAVSGGVNGLIATTGLLRESLERLGLKLYQSVHLRRRYPSNRDAGRYAALRAYSARLSTVAFASMMRRNQMRSSATRSFKPFRPMALAS